MKKKMLLLSLLVLLPTGSLFAHGWSIGGNVSVNLPGILGNAGFGRGQCHNHDHGNGGGGGGGQITVYSAVYGQNCGRPMNVAQHVQMACSMQGGSCNYYVNHLEIGDPAYGCPKDFQVLYTCGNGMRQAYVPPEASGRYATLSCW